jgi:hypothetical protein
MIPLTGLSAQIGLRLVDVTRDKQIALIQAQPQHSRAIEAFRERIADVETVDQLIADRDLYVFVMRAFDLEDQIFGKALISKMLKSDIDEPSALVNRLTDARLREMYKALGFGAAGEGNTNTIDPVWQGAMVARYVERLFINDQAEQNETVGVVLELRQKAAGIEGPFDILKNAGIAQFFRRALGLPDEMAQIDIDRQAALLEEKFDISTLQDPKVLDGLIRRYVAISDALDTSAASGNAAVMLMNSAVTARAGGQFVPITIDITAISLSSSAIYR